MLQKEGKSLTPLISEYGVLGTVGLCSLTFTKIPDKAVKDISLPGSFLASVVYCVPPQEGSLCMEFVLWILWPQGGGMHRPKPLSLIKSLFVSDGQSLNWEWEKELLLSNPGQGNSQLRSQMFALHMGWALPVQTTQSRNGSSMPGMEDTAGYLVMPLPCYIDPHIIS